MGYVPTTIITYSMAEEFKTPTSIGDSNHNFEGATLNSAASDASLTKRGSDDGDRAVAGLSIETVVAETGKLESDNASKDSDVVDWTGPNDPENPMNWTPARK